MKAGLAIEARGLRKSFDGKPAVDYTVNCEVGLPVQYGGGLRSLTAVREALRAGAERAVVGTAAFRDIDFLDDIVRTFGPRIVVSVDVRGGMISTSGWTQTTQMPAADAIHVHQL